MNMTAMQAASAFLMVAKASSAALPPNVQLALALADGALSAINLAVSNSTDITDEQLIQLMSLDDAARSDDRQAQLDLSKKAQPPTP